LSFGLRNRRIVIVGASSGIGLEVARGFLNEGAHVIITSERADVFDARTNLRAHGGFPVEALQFDITDRGAVIAAFAGLGHIDVLINNAGVYWATPSTDRSAQCSDTFIKQLMINVVGLWWCAIEAVPHMSEGGRIIFTSSISGRIGSLDHSSYSASKHAVLGMMKCMAKDLGPLGIAVNAVCPGSTATEMNIKAMPAESKERVKRSMALRPGLIDPAAHVGAYLFLASDTASEITGQTITVDRGQTIAAGG
jgi:NAD(P)-dependent dehydrogenase (short-subunit alcohol dehydrogenase family)